MMVENSYPDMWMDLLESDNGMEMLGREHRIYSVKKIDEQFF